MQGCHSHQPCTCRHLCGSSSGNLTAGYEEELFLINRFPDTKYQFVFATIGGRLFNRKNFTPVLARALNLVRVSRVCSPRSCSTAVTATDNSKGCFLTLYCKYPFPLCRSTKQRPKSFYSPGLAVGKAAS